MTNIDCTRRLALALQTAARATSRAALAAGSYREQLGAAETALTMSGSMSLEEAAALLQATRRAQEWMRTWTEAQAALTDAVAVAALGADRGRGVDASQPGG